MGPQKKKRKEKKRRKLKGLDYGCGIGRNTVLMEEFNIESKGVDISQEAIEKAKTTDYEEVDSEILGFGLANIQSAEEGTLTEIHVEGSEEVPN